MMMKTIVLFVLIISLCKSTLNAQNDTMYVIKNGEIVGKYNVNTELDSIIFYKPGSMPVSKFTDSRDGRVYRSITVGNQVWMAENLKYLPSVTGPGTSSSTSACYYVYGYNGTDVATAKTSINYLIYGVLYNWYAAMNGAASSSSSPSGVQGACPAGWHLPSTAEWTTLINSLGGAAVGGGKLKETGTAHWETPNTGATNEIFFTALPGGYVGNGSFYNIGSNVFWYSATAISGTDAEYRLIYAKYGKIDQGSLDKKTGLAVRCVKD